MKSLIPYMGGKSRLAPWIVSHFPKHHTYVEVFGGAGSVLFAKTRSQIEVYNDLWVGAYSLFEVVKNRPNSLIEKLEQFHYSDEEYIRLRKLLFESDARDELGLSFSTYVLGHFALSGNIWGDKKPTKRAKDKMKTFRNKIESIPLFSKRLQNVVIENLDFRELIPKYDGPETLFYCDPPYLGKKHYRPFTYRDHRELAKILNLVEGKVVVSFYPHSELNDLYPQEKWVRVEKEVVKQSIWSKAMKARYGKPKATELLLSNYSLVGAII